MTTLTAELQIVEQVHEDLGVHLKQIAAIIGADESTLHRWLSGTTASGPRKVYRSRFVALQELYTELCDVFRTLQTARRWLHEARPAAFGGRTPFDATTSVRILLDATKKQGRRVVYMDDGSCADGAGRARCASSNTSPQRQETLRAFDLNARASDRAHTSWSAP